MVYQKLLAHFGKQRWWPAESPFEVAVGAILVQRTTWRSVEKAIQNLKRAGLMDPRSLAPARLGLVEPPIRPTGF